MLLINCAANTVLALLIRNSEKIYFFEATNYKNSSSEIEFRDLLEPRITNVRGLLPCLLYS